MTGPRQNSKAADLSAKIKALGLDPGRLPGLADDLAALDPAWLAPMLDLARRCGPRAAEALRTAADVLPLLEPGPGAREMLSAGDPAAALDLLARLPELARSHGPGDLDAWLLLAAGLSPQRQRELAQRGPRLLAGLPDRASQRLVRRLALWLARGGYEPLKALETAARAAHCHPRGRVALGLALLLDPALTGAWLEAVENGPGRHLSGAELCRWTLTGLGLGRLAKAYFAPGSCQAQARADQLSGGLTLARLHPWLSRYASLHAGRRIKLDQDAGQDPTLPRLDLDDPGTLALADRLGPEFPEPWAMARALVALAAAARRLGLYDLDPKQVMDLLQGQGRQAPGLQELTPPALFCAGFSSPRSAEFILAMTWEVRVSSELERRLPGLARDLAALKRARVRAPRYWAGLEPATRVLTLAAHALAGGDRPAEVALTDWEAAVEIADPIRERAPGAGALELMSLAGDMYGVLRRARPAPAQRMAPSGRPNGPAMGSTAAGGMEKSSAPPTPLSTMGPGDGGAPPPWDQGAGRTEDDADVFTYPEWDAEYNRLRPGRTRVIQRRPPRKDAGELLQALKARSGLARRLEKAFGALAPMQPGLQRGFYEGPELDIGALARERAEARAGFCPRGRVFLRRRPRLRRISCGVLWDVSGSTKRSLEQGGGRGRLVAAAAREALALFAQALEAAGDEFALWAFSGAGRKRVDFYLLKNFQERMGPPVHERLAGLGPQAQNRDGAAIRHAASLLSQRSARGRLMIIITDGRPDDYGYGPEISERDLPLALASARADRVRPAAVLIVPPGRRPHPAYRAIPHLILTEVDQLARWLPAMYRGLTA